MEAVVGPEMRGGDWRGGAAAERWGVGCGPSGLERSGNLQVGSGRAKSLGDYPEQASARGPHPNEAGRAVLGHKCPREFSPTHPQPPP